MTVPVLTITTDKATYAWNDTVIVTASMTPWDPSQDVRLVIWEKNLGTAIDNKYFSKPPGGDTITWAVDGAVFAQPSYAGPYDAQIEYGQLHADVTFTHD